MTYLAETALLIGDARRAADIEQRLAPYSDRMGFASGEVSSGPVDRVRGLLAAFAGRYGEAIELLEDAERDAERVGARLWAVRSSVDRARVLVERDEPGDRALARDLIEAALPTCRALGLAAIERQARAVEDRLTRTGARSYRCHRHLWALEGPHSAGTVRCGRSGVIGSSGFGTARACSTCRGCSRNPAGSSTCSTLPGREPRRGSTGSADSGGAAIGLGRRRRDSGAVIDDEAKAAYRARLRELQAELDEAADFNDPVRGEGARLEMDALEAQLSAAFGLGGRARPEGSAAERARQSVTKAIREATRRISAEDSCDRGAPRPVRPHRPLLRLRPRSRHSGHLDHVNFGSAA